MVIFTTMFLNGDRKGSVLILLIGVSDKMQECYAMQPTRRRRVDPK